MATVEDIERLLKGQTKELKSNFEKELEKTKEDILQCVNQTLTVHTEKISKLEQKVSELSEREAHRTERELQREVNEKKNNVIFYKIAESEKSQDALMVAMVKMLNEETESTFETRDIDFLFRLGKKKEGEMRPILTRFTTLAKKDLVIRNKKKLAEKKIEIGEDFPIEIRKRRKALAPFVQALKEKGIMASLRVDKIKVNGEFWSLEKVKENLFENEENHASTSSASSEINIYKRKEISPKRADSNYSKPKRRPPPIKLSSVSNANNGSSIKKFFDPPSTPTPKSPIVTVATPSKNSQYVQIINDE